MTRSTTSGSRWRGGGVGRAARWSIGLLVLAALVAVASGCGTRQSRVDVEAAARGSLERGESSGSGSGIASGDGSVSGDGTSGDGPADAGATSQGAAATESSDTAASTGETTGAAESAGPRDSGGGGGEPIVIGNVSTTSGIAGVPQAPGVRALQAWVAMTNEAGGINGHPVRLVVADDGADPARHAAAVKDLVENDGVIAFVSNWAAQTVHAARPYLEEKRIPVIGGDSSNPAWFESPMLFAQGPAADHFMRARLKALASVTDERKIATFVCREAETCTLTAQAVKRHAQEFGFEVVYQAQASLAQPDFTAECISARNAGAELILLHFEAASMRRIAQSCDRQGYRPTYDLTHAMEPDLADIPAFDGATVSYPSFPVYADAPAAKEFRDALSRYAPNQPPAPVAGMGWAAAQLFGKVAAAAFPPDATPTTPPLLDALWSIENDTIGGLTGPLTYRRDQPSGPTAPRCLFTERIQGGGFVAPNGMEPTCA